MKPTIGVIGLGIMGGAMAEALLASGHKVIGYDVRDQARQRLRRAGGKAVASGTAAASSADLLITSLATVAALDDAVDKIALAKRGANRPALIVIETSTLPIADKTRALKRLQRAGVALLDCPISGTAVRMKEGAWTIFVSGSAAAYRRAKPLFEVFTRNAPYVGAFGNGTKMKFIANHMVAIQNVAVGESMTFARRMGLDAQQVWELFAASPVIGSGVFKLRGKFMVERTYLPATMKVEVWQKDMQVIGDMAHAVNCPTPLFSACVPLFNAAMAQGLGQHDTASVCEVLDAMAGGSRVRKKR
jgi:L-threonate 2-dehydrogenase